MKKLIALMGISLLFSGATLTNRAGYRIKDPIKKDSIKVDVITEKLSKLDSLLLELNKYENKTNK